MALVQIDVITTAAADLFAGYGPTSWPQPWIFTQICSLADPVRRAWEAVTPLRETRDPASTTVYSLATANRVDIGGRRRALKRPSMQVSDHARSPADVVVRICKAGVGSSILLVSTTFDLRKREPVTDATPAFHEICSRIRL